MESLINQWRIDQGLSSLYQEDALQRTADLYVQELVSLGRLSHVDTLGRRVQGRYRDGGGSAVATGEVLGTQSADSAEQHMLQLWIDSPTHRDVLGNSRWSTMAVARETSEESVVWVVLFSNSLISDMDENGNFSFIPQDLLYIRSLPDRALHTIENPSTFIIPEAEDEYRLLEFLDSHGRLRNRIILSPADF